MIKIAINGLGRIGRNILKAFYEDKRFREHLRIVAVNDLGPIDHIAHLIQFDTVHGRFPGKVSIEGQSLLINDDEIPVLQERAPENLPWKKYDVDIVLECTGHFASREKASLHLPAGAKKVLISAPAGEEVDATIVYGVNHQILNPRHRIVSNASCTTNCLVPLVQPLHQALGIESGLMTTVHAYTNDQVLIDVNHADIRRARSATHSMIPTKTGAASSIGLVMPELKGKLDGFALRVPTINVSVVDLNFIAKRETTAREVNQILEQAAVSGPLKDILVINQLPLVSVDFNHHPASAIFDTTQTKVIGRLVKVLAWYDNEWGFSNRMLDTALIWG